MRAVLLWEKSDDRYYEALVLFVFIPRESAPRAPQLQLKENRYKESGLDHRGAQSD